MKKNLIKSVFVVAVAMLAGINVFNAQKTVVLSDVAKENVEALASDESGKKVYCCGKYGTCAKLLDGGEIVGLALYTPCPEN